MKSTEFNLGLKELIAGVCGSFYGSAVNVDTQPLELAFLYLSILLIAFCRSVFQR